MNFSIAVKVGKEPKTSLHMLRHIPPKTTLHMLRHIPDLYGRKIYKLGQEKFIYKPFSLGYEVMAGK